MRTTIRTADETTVRTLDGLVVFWLVLWLVVGVWSGITIWQVAEVGDTVTNSGEALGDAGAALQDLEGVPVVGERPGELGADVVATAADIAERGQRAKGELRRLALLLGLSIVAIPTTPVLGLYVPLRWARHHEIREIRRSLATGDVDGLDRYLAGRAIHAMPYASVAAVSADPWGDLDRGETRSLADAELARLGVRRPRE